MNFAILGAGNIAEKMALAINGIRGEVNAYAVASRSYEKAKAFADKYGFARAYGSYEELVKDEKVDLIYIATPHAMHYQNSLLCIENGKAILVEKAFCANTKQTMEVISKGKEKNVLVAEAMWTRYLPQKEKLIDILNSGEIGEVLSVEANFSVPICQVPRLNDPALCGGALLDLGIYPLTFASIFLGDDYKQMESTCIKYETGVDATDIIIITYKNGKKAFLRTSMVSGDCNEGIINCSLGYIRVKGLNNFEEYEVYDKNGKLIRKVKPDMIVNGYEYEVLACKKALEDRKLECDSMSHKMILRMMGQMDELRNNWGVKYPFE